MSKYCGKCDLYDSLMTSEESRNRISSADIYHRGNLLNINTEKDLSLYFPYIIGIMVSSNGTSTIHISDTDYIRYNEIDMLELYTKLILREKRRIRRNKLEYSADGIFKKVFGYFSDSNKEQIYELIHMAEHSNKIDVSNIRLASSEMYREEWFRDLVNIYGYDDEFARDWVWHLGGYKDV